MGRGEKIGLMLQGRLVYQSPTFLMVSKRTRTAGLAPCTGCLWLPAEQGALRSDCGGFLASLSGVPKAAGAGRAGVAAGGRCPSFRAMERSPEDAVAEQCCCLAVRRESILWVAQERRDLGMGDTSQKG